MDHLNAAKSSLGSAWDNEDHDDAKAQLLSQFAIAHALIALVEEMRKIATTTDSIAISAMEANMTARQLDRLP